MESAELESVQGSRLKGFAKWLGSYKGLITATIVYEFCLIAFLGSFSEPVVQMFGAPLIPIILDPATRISRIIMLYHSLAITFLAAVVFFVLDIMDVRTKYETMIKWTMLPGFLLTSLAGMTFAYLLPQNWVAHSLFIFGQSIVFISGVLLAIAVFPTKSFLEERGQNHWGGKIAQWSLFLTAVCLLVSATIGAVAGSYFGNGFESFLAEDLLRFEHDLFDRMIIGHLHIMLALIDAAVLLLVFRYANREQSGRWYLVAMILTIPGTLIMSAGAWLVLTGWESAHTLITIGSSFSLSAALILVLSGWKKTAMDALGEAYSSSPWLQRIVSVLKDPVLFGLYFLFIWVNVVVTFPGITLAINLDEFRAGPWEIERTIAAGHWHVLATLTAMMVFLLTLDHMKVKGIARQIIGWITVAGSVVAFLFAIYYMFPHFGVDPAFAFFVTDLGIILLFAGLAIFCVHQLVELILGKKEETQ
ncbi:MAG: hypothetical protein ACTSV2_07195 [Candidatus Thorarchaeota archaeon]